MIGTVPIYDAIVYYNKPLQEITAKEWLDVVRMHAEDGVDFMTNPLRHYQSRRGSL